MAGQMTTLGYDDGTAMLCAGILRPRSALINASEFETIPAIVDRLQEEQKARRILSGHIFLMKNKAG